jgi:hypothetical protein
MKRRTTNKSQILMKKLILAIAVATFTVGAFAGDACCEKEKAAVAAKDKATCPASKDAAQCPAAGATAKKDADKKLAESPKGAQAKKS